MLPFATGSSRHHEHFQTLRLPDDELRFLKTAAAFANGAGGTIFIVPLPSGFSTSEEVTATFRQAEALLADSLSTPAPHLTATEAFKDGVALRIEIFPCAEPPCFLRSVGPTDGTYIRVDAETQLASEATRRELELQRTHAFWDSTAPSEATPATQERLDRFGELLQKEWQRNQPDAAPVPLTPQALASQGLLVSKDGAWLPSNAFLLFEGGCRNAGIRCGLYLGTSDIVIGDVKLFTGGLLEQFHEAENWILSKLETRQLSDANHTTLPEVPPAAVRAMLINAFCYRSGLQSNEPIDVAVYKNRIDITTPGGLPLNFPLESLLDGAAAFRNPAVASALADAGLMSPWQSVVPYARQAMKAWGLPAPLFEQTGSALRVTLRRPGDVAITSARLHDILAFNAADDAETASTAAEASAAPCSERGQRMLQLIAADPSITIPELMAAMELTEGQAKFELKKLKAAGRLAREGTKKGRWRILLDPTAVPA